MELLNDVLHLIVEGAILLFEFMGVAVLIAAGVRGIWNYLRRDPLTRLKLAKGMAMGLEFKLGSEILRTVVVRQMSEIMIVGAIIVLRAALTFLIHWKSRTRRPRWRPIWSISSKRNKVRFCGVFGPRKFF